MKRFNEVLISDALKVIIIVYNSSLFFFFHTRPQLNPTIQLIEIRNIRVNEVLGCVGKIRIPVEEVYTEEGEWEENPGHLINVRD